MKISLRKVNALQLSINQVINKITFSSEVAISEFEDYQAVIAARRADLTKNMERRDALVDVLYGIRIQVGEANHKSGVDTVLAMIAQIDKKLQVLELLVTQRPKMDDTIISGKLNKIRSRSSDSEYYGHENAVVTNSLSQEELDVFKTTSAKLKKQKQTLQDQLLELNVRTEIDLDANAVAVLEAEQLL